MTKARGSGVVVQAARGLVAASVPLLVAGLRPGVAHAAPTARWTAPTADANLALAAEHARRGGAEGLAGVATLSFWVNQATPGAAARLLAEIGAGPSDVAADARWVAAELDRTAPPGLVRDLAVIGPFLDNEGKVKDRAKDLAEASVRAWTDRAKKHDWGAEEVRWRDLPFQADARGAPLGLLFSPRRETCAYVASRLHFDAATSVNVYLASTGAARLVWDGADLGASEALHQRALFDRIGARVEVTPGDHLVAAKVCTGPHDDRGRVRIRVEGADGRPARFTASRDLGPLASRPFPRVTARSFETTAARALRETEGATGAARLAALVLLTIGGLDDQRSPRASALVDAIVSDPSSSPDSVAAAAALSAFGAVRTGALHAATDRAAASGDLATADFAERQLVHGRLGSGYVDWAIAGLSAAPFARATDVEARALRAFARSSLGALGADRAATTELTRLVDELGARAPRSVLEDLAIATHAVDPELEIRARAAMDRLSPGYEAPALVQAWANRGGAAANGAAFAALYAVDDIHDAEAMVDAVARTGRPLELAEIARRAIELDPNVSALHRHRAEALFAIAARDSGGAAAGRADLRAAGVAELTRAGAMNSARATNEEIGVREGRPAAVVRDERYLAEPSTFLERARKTPAIAGQVEGRVLHYARIVTLHPERRVTDLVHYAREIVAPPTGDADLVEEVQLWGRTYDIVRARVYRRDGGVASAEEERADAKGVRIKWPDLKPGDVVEVAVRAHRAPQGGRGDAPLYVVLPIVSHSTRPLLHGEVVVESPASSPLAIDVLNGAPDETKRTSDAKHVTTRYVWNAPPTFDDEPLAPGPSEIFPTVVASRQATWKEFRAWYEAATQGFSEPDAQIRELADKLTKGKATRDERIRALFDFVSDDIRYVNYQSAEAWLPNRPQQLLARRQGDCDDKATLLITLLKAIGVDATLALVQTRLHPAPSLMTAKGAVVPLFDHGIAYVPARGGAPAMWLDATSPESRVGPLPAMDLRASAFFVSEGEPVITRAPAGSPSDHGFDYRWTIELAADGSAKVDAENLARGGSAHQVRSALRENTNRASWVEEHLAGQQLPQVAVEPSVDVDADQPNGAARVKFRAKSAAFGRREHGDLVVPLGDHATLASQLASAPTRALPLVLPFFVAPHEDVETLRIVAPEGMAPGALPARGVEDGGDFGRAVFEAKLDPKEPRAVVVTIALALDLDVIPAARYAAYRAWLARVDALLRKEIRFTPRRR